MRARGRTAHEDGLGLQIERRQAVKEGRQGAEQQGQVEAAVRQGQQQPRASRLVVQKR